MLISILEEVGKSVSDFPDMGTDLSAEIVDIFKLLDYFEQQFAVSSQNLSIEEAENILLVLRQLIDATAFEHADTSQKLSYLLNLKKIQKKYV